MMLAFERRIREMFAPPIAQWEVNSYGFGQTCSYPNEDGTLKYWGIHVGADMDCNPGTRVHSIAAGTLIYRGYHPGSSKDHRNWGGIVVIGHEIRCTHDRTTTIYSLYGHINAAVIRPGEKVTLGQEIGGIAGVLTPENGWWEDAHLHLGILIDPSSKYMGGVLPGYDNGKQQFSLKDWVDPVDFFINPAFVTQRALTR